MDKVDLGDKLPVGFCNECLRRMVRGALYETRKLPQGRSIVHAYCEHLQAGAAMVVIDGWSARWTITMPIDVLDWQQLLELKAAALSKFLGEPAQAPTLAPGAHVPTSELIN